MSDNVTKLQVLPDPFDPENLRLDQSFVETSGVKKLLTTVPVRKPNNQDFNRVHSNEAYRLTAAIIELKDDREVYLVFTTYRPSTAGRMFTGHYLHGQAECNVPVAGQAANARW